MMSKKKQTRKSVFLFLAFLLAFASGVFVDEWISPAAGKGHEAAHQGVLNVIGEEVGHAEIRVTGAVIELWFVGGGNDTDRAVPIKADEIKLTIEKDLVLRADPLVLAGESQGSCSHFIAHCDWLSAMEEFAAHGHVLFKGQEFDLVIRYPQGYDPHHGPGHEREHKHYEH